MYIQHFDLSFHVCQRRANVQEIPDTEYTVKGLQEGKEYEFRVAAVNAAGIGDFSDETSAIKAAPPPGQETPAEEKDVFLPSSSTKFNFLIVFFPDVKLLALTQ